MISGDHAIHKAASHSLTDHDHHLWLSRPQLSHVRASIRHTQPVFDDMLS